MIKELLIIFSVIFIIIFVFITEKNKFLSSVKTAFVITVLFYFYNNKNFTNSEKLFGGGLPDVINEQSIQTENIIENMNTIKPQPIDYEIKSIDKTYDFLNYLKT